MKEFIKKYRLHINPPYKRHDIPALFATVISLLIIPVTVFVASNPTRLLSRASVDTHVRFVNPDTMQVVTSINTPQVGVLLTSPWSIAMVQGMKIAAQKNPVNIESNLGKSEPTKTVTGGAQQSPTPEHNGGHPSSTPQVTNPPSTEITASIQLAEDANFTRNLMTVTPTSNPFLVRYAFSNGNAGTKTLYAKFVSTRGTSRVFSSTIRLISGTGGATTTITNTVMPSRPPSGGGTQGTGGVRPFSGAPVCPDSGIAHNTNQFHTLWDSERGCHYDHEHGQNPLNSEVSALFPGFNLLELTGGVSIGHTNPSSSMENTHKHGGFKWQFMSRHPEGCAGFEGAANGVNGSLVQLHGFGGYTMELTGRIHSSLALLRMCNTANPNDFGYLYTVQFQDYGQIVSPYQGDIIAFPFTPNPSYDSPRGPYLTIDCVGQKGPGELGACRESRELVLNRGLDANSNWSSKPTGVNIPNPFGSTLFNLFFRLRDTYQLIDWSDQTYPFTFKWLCSSNGGATYNPSGCGYNNSTVQLHEIAGTIPESWDNLSGFDTDSRVGRVTATGFTDRFGVLNRSCVRPSVGANGDRNGDCFPVKMVNAFVGKYGSILVYTAEGKGTNIVPYLPEKDIYFCNGTQCEEGDPGAVSSGWIGQNN